MEPIRTSLAQESICGAKETRGNFSLQETKLPTGKRYPASFLHGLPQLAERSTQSSWLIVSQVAARRRTEPPTVSQLDHIKQRALGDLCEGTAVVQVRNSTKQIVMILKMGTRSWTGTQMLMGLKSVVPTRSHNGKRREKRCSKINKGRSTLQTGKQESWKKKRVGRAILKARTNDKARADKRSAERERKDSDRAEAGLAPIHNLPPVPRKLFSSQPEEGGVPPPSTTGRRSSAAQPDSSQPRSGSTRRSVPVDEELKRDEQRRVLFSSPMVARMSGTPSILNTKRDSPSVVIESPNDRKTRATKQSPSGASQRESIVISSGEEEEDDEEEDVEDSGSANGRDVNGPSTSLAEVTQTKAKDSSSNRETAAPREEVNGGTTHTAGNTQPSPVLPRNSASAANRIRHSPSQKSPASADMKQPGLTQKPGLLTQQSTSTQESTVSSNKSPTLARKLRSSAQPSPASAQEAPDVTSKISVATFSHLA
ncbi:hypothetical protein BJ546DRAFT_257702 [Cryomyces antarcticus]